jgi:hypothetical protein
MCPKLWPISLSYARESISYEMNIHLLRQYLARDNVEDGLKQSWVIEEKCIHPYLEIKKIQQPHPLCDQKTRKGHVNYGVFAAEKIDSGIELGEYVGEMWLRNSGYSINTMCDNLGSSDYRWIIQVNTFYVIIDAQNIANEMSLVNDYRGISSKPNVVMREIMHQGLVYYGYVTICEIQRNEEVLVDYGFRFKFEVQ